MGNWIKYKKGVGDACNFFRSSEEAFNGVGQELIMLLQVVTDRHTEFVLDGSNGEPTILDLETGLPCYKLKLKDIIHPMYLIIIEPSTENDRNDLKLITR